VFKFFSKIAMGAMPIPDAKIEKRFFSFIMPAYAIDDARFVRHSFHTKSISYPKRRRGRWPKM